MARKLIVEVVGDASSLERAFGRARTATNQFDRDLGKSGRGVLAVASGYHSLARSVAFASASFLGAAGLTSLLKASVGEAETSEKAYAAVSTAIERIGGNADESLPSIRAWAAEQAKFGVSANVAVTGLARLVEITGSQRKAMEAYTAALVISKATGKDFNAVSLAVGKAFTGQTTALSRYIGKVKAGTSVNALLATVMARYGGQAEANTLATDRLHAALANAEDAIGQALLPTVEKLSGELATWLSDSQNQERIQRDVTQAVAATTTVLKDAAEVVKAVDKATGSLTNTLELLLALKVGFVVAGWAGALGLFATAETAVSEAAVVSRINAYTSGVAAAGTTAATSAVRVGALRAALLRLGAIGVITVAVEVAIHHKQIDDVIKSIQDKLVDLQKHSKPVQLLAKGESEVANLPGIKQGLSLFGVRNVTPESLLVPLGKVGHGLKEVTADARVMGEEMALAGVKAAHGLGLAAQAAEQADNAVRRLNITASQRNTFFDNAVARILLRGGLGTISQQTAALQEANRRIEARIKATKDVTRRLNLEDQLLQNQAQIQSLQAQATADAAQSAADALSKRQAAVGEMIANLQLGVTKAEATVPFDDDIVALKALQAGIRAEIAEFGKTADLEGQLFDVQQRLTAARASKIAGRQFAALGLSPTGDKKIPGVTALRRALGNVTDEVAGTFLDTKKVKSLLGAIRRILSGGLGEVGSDVRAKIQQILGDLNKQLDDSTQKNLTKWKHLSTQAFLAGVPDLTPEQKRLLEKRLSTLGPGGVVPGSQTKAFALAGGAQTVDLSGDVLMDGEKVGRITKSHQLKRARSRTITRAG